jgi:hypothetical protein
MTRLLGSRICWISCTLVALLSAVAPAQSRPWSRNPINLAQDYLTINDNDGRGDIILIIWIAPPMVPSGPTTQAVRDLLDKYAIIGAVHAHASNEGTFTFDKITDLEVADGSGQPLKSLSADTMPATVTGLLATLQSVYGRSLGAVGQGMQLFAFDSGAAHACAKGGLAVSYGGQKYTYDTPVPGCP